LKPDELPHIQRGDGFKVIPLVGRWNAHSNQLVIVATSQAANEGQAAQPSLHTHEVDEAIIVLEGHMLLTIGTANYVLDPGDVAWVPADEPHAASPAPDGAKSYSVYAAHHATRKMVDTGEVFPQISDEDMEKLGIRRT
jgi:hypothetical protein